MSKKIFGLHVREVDITWLYGLGAEFRGSRNKYKYMILSECRFRTRLNTILTFKLLLMYHEVRRTLHRNWRVRHIPENSG